MGYRTFFLLALIALCPALLSAQPQWEAFADARQVLQNNYFDLTFTLRNAEGSNFQPPQGLEDRFTIISGPARGLRTSIINGQVTRESSWSYTLQPRRTGELTIGPATIEVDGRTLRTRPLTVTALAPGEGAGTDARDYFLRAELSTGRAYVGEQITLDYKLYTTRDIEGINPMAEPAYEGFFMREVRRFDSRVQREVINGRQYKTRILRRLVLYPQQSGELTIDAYRILLGVVTESDRQSGFFFRRKLSQVPVETEPVSVQVLPLPEPVPDDFSGAVGRFDLKAGIDRTNISTDDALTITLELTGEGDIKRIQAPEWEVPQGLELYDPRTKTEELIEDPLGVTGRKVFEYLLVPGQAGEYRLQPTFTYFNADSAAYVTERTEVFVVNVSRGSGKTAAVRPGQPEETEPAGLRPPAGRIRLRQPGSPGWEQPWFWLLLGLPLLLLSGAWWYRRRHEREAAIDPAERRRQQARQIAAQKLQRAEKLMQQEKVVEFYREVDRAMLGFVSDKLQLPTAELTKENLHERLLAGGADRELADDFVAVLQQCEKARYGGAARPADMQPVYLEAVRLLAATSRLE